MKTHDQTTAPSAPAGHTVKAGADCAATSGAAADTGSCATGAAGTAPAPEAAAAAAEATTAAGSAAAAAAAEATAAAGAVVLPEKGVARIKAINELGQDESNAPLLFDLVKNEKGKYKTAAQQALALLEYEPAAPMWARMVKGKLMGSSVLLKACSDTVSEAAGPEILKRLSAMLDIADDRVLTRDEQEQFNLCINLMLGKASPAMLEVYRYMAGRIESFASLRHAPLYDGDNCNTWHIGDHMGIYHVGPEELQKIPAVTLSASLIYSSDPRLHELAAQLYAAHGGVWLISALISDIINRPGDVVYNRWSPLLKTDDRALICNALALLDFCQYPRNWKYERCSPDGMRALVFWGMSRYGVYDYSFVFDRPVNLDERWIYDLAVNPEENKPAVTWQSYNRSGVLMESYDEMLISLLPLYLENEELKAQLRHYFSVRASLIRVEKSITVYKDAAKRFGTEKLS